MHALRPAWHRAHSASQRARRAFLQAAQEQLDSGRLELGHVLGLGQGSGSLAAVLERLLKGSDKLAKVRAAPGRARTPQPLAQHERPTKIHPMMDGTSHSMRFAGYWRHHQGGAGAHAGRPEPATVR